MRSQNPNGHKYEIGPLSKILMVILAITAIQVTIYAITELLTNLASPNKKHGMSIERNTSLTIKLCVGKSLTAR